MFGDLLMMNDKNVDHNVVNGFGEEWEKFDQSSLPENEKIKQFDDYFDIFPWDLITNNSEGFDAGCGSGRWAMLMAPRVKKLYCVDPSVAIKVAEKNLQEENNCEFYNCTVSEMPFLDNSMDFGYSLGVLHHIPDTQQGIMDCTRKLKSGAPFLLYLYYAFDNQPRWYYWVWRISDIVRRIIWRLPNRAKSIVCDLIALSIYFPLSRFGLLIEKIGISIHSWPLSAYRNQSLYFMRTDALDRFGTKLEHRFTKKEINNMMTKAGLGHIKFSSHTPFWCAVGIKK